MKDVFSVFHFYFPRQFRCGLQTKELTMLGFIIGAALGFVAGVLVGRNNKAKVEAAVAKGQELGNKLR